MAISIVNVFKKLSAFWLRIMSTCHPAVKAAKSRTVHQPQMDGLAHSPSLKRSNQQLALRIRFFEVEKPPPLNYASNP